MDRQEIRLELLRLTYSHGRDTSEAVQRAKDLEAYVYSEGAKRRGRPPKSGNLETGRKTTGQTVP